MANLSLLAFVKISHGWSRTLKDYSLEIKLGVLVLAFVIGSMSGESRLKF